MFSKLVVTGGGGNSREITQPVKKISVSRSTWSGLDCQVSSDDSEQV